MPGAETFKEYIAQLSCPGACTHEVWLWQSCGSKAGTLSSADCILKSCTWSDDTVIS